MKYLPLIALLMFMQASPPVPRQTPNNPASATQKIKSQSETNKSPAPPTAANSPIQPKPTQGNSSEQAQSNKKNAVTVTEFPPVSIQKDWSDWGVWIFSGLLVVVGLLQTGLLYMTWKQIRRQAGLMEKQLTTMGGQLTEMGKSVSIVIDKERARITIEPPDDFKFSKDVLNTITYNVHVYAPTPAIIVEARAGAQVLESEGIEMRWPPHPMSLTSIDTRSTHVIAEKSLLFITPNDLVDIRERRQFVHFFGFIKYKDVFQTKTDLPHETTFGYLWAVGSDIEGKPPELGIRWASGWVENPTGANSET